jgi:hypothetical protein
MLIVRFIQLPVADEEDNIISIKRYALIQIASC